MRNLAFILNKLATSSETFIPLEFGPKKLNNLHNDRNLLMINFAPPPCPPPKKFLEESQKLVLKIQLSFQLTVTYSTIPADIIIFVKNSGQILQIQILQLLSQKFHAFLGVFNLLADSNSTNPKRNCSWLLLLPSALNETKPIHTKTKFYQLLQPQS